jgi:hypothetical protein
VQRRPDTSRITFFHEYYQHQSQGSERSHSRARRPLLRVWLTGRIRPRPDFHRISPCTAPLPRGGWGARGTALQETGEGASPLPGPPKVIATTVHCTGQAQGKTRFRPSLHRPLQGTVFRAAPGHGFPPDIPSHCPRPRGGGGGRRPGGVGGLARRVYWCGGDSPPPRSTVRGQSRKNLLGGERALPGDASPTGGLFWNSPTLQKKESGF